MLACIRVCGAAVVFVLDTIAASRARRIGNTGVLSNAGTQDSVIAACLAPCTALGSQMPSEARTKIICLAIHICWMDWGAVERDLTKRERSSIWSWLYTAFYALIVLGSLIVGLGDAVSIREISNYPGLVITQDFNLQQNSWGYGQLVAVILLVLPGLAALEGYKCDVPTNSIVRTSNLSHS
jgi:hypothetical protein